MADAGEFCYLFDETSMIDYAVFILVQHIQATPSNGGGMCAGEVTLRCKLSA